MRYAARTIWIGGMGLMLLAGAPPGLGQATPATSTAPAGSAEQQVDAIIAGYQQAMREFSQAYQSAKTDQERQTLFDTKYPTESGYFPRLMAIARAHPNTEAALKALQWVIQQSGRSSPTKTSAEAFAIVTRDFAADPKVIAVVRQLDWTMDPAAEPLLRAVIQSNPDSAVRGDATFALARFLKNNSELVRTIRSSPASATQMATSFGQSNIDALRKHDPDAMTKEAVALFEQVKKQYPDVQGGFNGTLGKSADAELFELQHLAIGQTAPEITGTDIDGKPMKLSDFRGKLVMLDFWGDW